MKYNEIRCFGRADAGRPRVLDFVGLEHETGPGGHNGIWGNLAIFYGQPPTLKNINDFCQFLECHEISPLASMNSQ